MKSGKAVDMNADAGESFGSWSKGNDEALFEHITSVNVACGFHAGDPVTMRRTVGLAKDAGVKVGAHPSFRDLIGFGRREVGVNAEDVYAETLYQLGALSAILRSESLELHHVSPHGALGWATWRSREIATAVVDAVENCGRMPIMSLGNTAIEEVLQRRGLRIVRLGFPERGYLPDGRLAPRGTEGAVINDPSEAAERAVSMVLNGRVKTVEGDELDVQVDSLLIHGDNPEAPDIAKAVNRSLTQAGIKVAAF